MKPDPIADFRAGASGSRTDSRKDAVAVTSRLAAGFNRRLYAYIEQFKDFYADAKGEIKKKIILKVSDFRSTIIQGKFLAKKGLWVSEYRIESGLNCGGHRGDSGRVDGQGIGSHRPCASHVR